MTANFFEFQQSLREESPPDSFAPHLKAMWYDAKNQWEKAHQTIADMHDQTAAWVHAYLHRKEGDTGNARYWYEHANKKMPGYSLEKERDEIVMALL